MKSSQCCVNVSLTGHSSDFCLLFVYLFIYFIPGSFVNGHLKGSGVKTGLFGSGCKAERPRRSAQTDGGFSGEGPVRKRWVLSSSLSFVMFFIRTGTELASLELSRSLYIPLHWTHWSISHSRYSISAGFHPQLKVNGSLNRHAYSQERNRAVSRKHPLLIKQSSPG